MPITSPADRISGPRIGSDSRNLLKGNTASLTEMSAGTISSVTPAASSDSPSITRAAADANGTPVAFEMNGTVRLARGFTSITYTTRSLIAYCTLMSPTTPNASAKATVWRRVVSRSFSPMTYDGRTNTDYTDWIQAC